MAGCFWTWPNYITAITGKKKKQTVILEFAGDRQNLPQPTEGQAVLLTCLCVRALRFVLSTYRSVLVSDSTLLSPSVFFHSIPSPVLSCAQFMMFPPAFIYLFSCDSK